MDKDNNNKEPNLIRKGWSLTKSLIRYASEGFPNVSEEIFEKRMLICNSCELLKRDKGTCGVCGCVVEYKGRMKTESCPKNKW
jgi:hypothetical protein|tara:strand:- start:759 stop:1007 length:249 start_codon:yes stop_codon:yes gene_type:complete